MKKESQEIFDYIFGLTVPGVKLELIRVNEFISRLGNPQDTYPIVHIAGTNGKGSTAAMLAAITNAYGIRTGLFTSPHLIKPNERIRIGDSFIPDEFIVRKVGEWKSTIDELGITFFEVLAALAMVYFKEQEVDLAVFETGLGGRLDATNIVNPKVSIITAISKDHENILGDTLEKIAMEKAGIIKPKTPLILGKNIEQIVALMRTVSTEKKAEMYYVPDHCSYSQSDPDELTGASTFHCAESRLEIDLPLPGAHQLDNFANVLVALKTLGLELDAGKIRTGLEEMRWLGRMQTLSQEPHIVYDVAHNVEGLSALLHSLDTAHRTDAILIAAFNARKNVASMIEILNKWTGPVIFTDFEGHSALGREGMLAHGIDPEKIENDPISAIEYAIEMRSSRDQIICIFGSHYLAETLFDHFEVVV